MKEEPCEGCGKLFMVCRHCKIAIPLNLLDGVHIGHCFKCFNNVTEPCPEITDYKEEKNVSEKKVVEYAESLDSMTTLTDSTNKKPLSIEELVSLLKIAADDLDEAAFTIQEWVSEDFRLDRDDRQKARNDFNSFRDKAAAIREAIKE